MAIKTQAELEQFISEFEKHLESIEELVKRNIPFSGELAGDCARVNLTNHLISLSNTVNGLTLEDTAVQDDWEQHSVNYGFVKDRFVLHR